MMGLADDGFDKPVRWSKLLNRFNRGFSIQETRIWEQRKIHRLREDGDQCSVRVPTESPLHMDDFWLFAGAHWQVVPIAACGRVSRCSRQNHSPE